MAPLIPKLLKQKIIYCIIITTKNKGRRVFNDMKMLGVLFPVIAIISVAVMIVWGMLGNAWNISWIAVFIGGCLMAILAIVMGAMNKKK